MWKAYPEDFQFSGERAATLLIGQEGSLGRTSLRYFAQVDLEAFAGLHYGEDGRNFGTGFLASDM